MNGNMNRVIQTELGTELRTLSRGRPSILLSHAVCSEGQWQMEHFCDFQQPRGAQPLAATSLGKLILLHRGQRSIQPNQQSQTLYTIKVLYVVSADAKKMVWWDFWLGGSLPPAINSRNVPRNQCYLCLVAPCTGWCWVAGVHGVVRICQSGRNSGSASGSYGGERRKALLILYRSCWPNISSCSL